jgi:ATP-dependent DNA helicase DinG
MADTPGPLTLDPDAARTIRQEIERAGGREVCFLAEVTEERSVVRPRAVARGNSQAVLAVARDAAEGQLMIHNHPSGVLDPSPADLAVAARIFDEGLGSALVDNLAGELYVVVEPPTPRVILPLDPEELESRLAPGGSLSTLSPGFEDRPGQRAMLRAVVDTFNDGGVTMVEAGTGTGKSLAYLLPAARWALQNGERTVVSTNTINLQEQLVGKDLLLVEQVLGDSLRWALVKGRGNYISIRRARLALGAQDTLFSESREADLEALLAWIEETEDGSLSDLPEPPPDDVWEEVKSDGDICLRARCPHFQECFYQKSRRDAASANLLVVNHHMLFSDLSVRIATDNYSSAAVLPSYRRLVLDEAHNVEDAATSHLGSEVTRTGLYRVLSRLDRKGRGLLASVQKELGSTGSDEAARLNRRVEERLRPALGEVRARVDLLMDALEPMAAGADGTLRLGSEPAGEPADREDLRDRLESTLDQMGRLERELRHLREGIEDHPELLERLEDRTLDLRSCQRRLAAAADGLRRVLLPGPDSGSYVRWMERRGTRNRSNLALAAAPLRPGPLLREGLFEKVETVVLTSATLRTRKDFRFLRDRLGLAPEHGHPGPDGRVRVDLGGVVMDPWVQLEPGPGPDLDSGGTEGEPAFPVRELAVPSPFRYEEQASLLVPTDLGDPATSGAAFDSATARFVRELAERTDGGMFVLFTSFRALRAVAADLRSQGGTARWPLLVHGEGPRSRLLAEFVDSGRAILLGTASFWEGVDVPGDPLRALVIQRLPFPVPTEPVTEARVEAMEAEGRNSFWEYMLPLAALRLKQGVGRLIRSRGDRGMVAVLDSRILTRRYGMYFRDSLPPFPFVKAPADELWARLEDRGMGS